MRIRAGMLILVVAASCGCSDDDANKNDGQDASGASDVAFQSDTVVSGGPCDDCAKDNDCGPGLTCDKPAFVCKTPKQVKAGLPVCDVDCAESPDCASVGLCGYVGGTCQAGTLAHCVASAGCKGEAKCTASGGKCIIGGDADCQKSNACQDDGKCTHKGDACVATTGITCGDGTCDIGETKTSCEADCGPPGVICSCDAGQCGIKPGCSNDCGGCKSPLKCVANGCTDAKCKLPDAWPVAVQRVSKLALLDHKKGCDLDDTAKPNNGLGKVLSVYPFTNEAVAEAIVSGAVSLLLRPIGYKAQGQPFTLQLLVGQPAKTGATCSASATDCTFQVKAASYDLEGAAGSTCTPVATFPGAKASGGLLSGGGQGNKVDIPVYVVGVPVVAKVGDARVSGEITGGETWKSTRKGMVCGAVAMKDIAAAVNSLPPAAFKGSGFDKKAVDELVEGLLVPDWDLDGDGKMDAVTAAWSFETVAAQAVGVE